MNHSGANDYDHLYRLTAAHAGCSVSRQRRSIGWFERSGMTIEIPALKVDLVQWNRISTTVREGRGVRSAHSYVREINVRFMPPAFAFIIGIFGSGESRGGGGKISRKSVSDRRGVTLLL